MKTSRTAEWMFLVGAVCVWAVFLVAKNAAYDFNYLLLLLSFLLSTKVSLFIIFFLLFSKRITRGVRIGAVLFLLTSSPVALALAMLMLEPHFTS